MKFSNYVLCANVNPDEIDVSVWISCDSLDEVQQARVRFKEKWSLRKALHLLKRIPAEEVNTWMAYTVLAYELLEFNEYAIWRCESNDGRIAKALAQFDDIECELVVYEHIKNEA